MSDDEAKARLDNYLSHMLEAAQLARQYVHGVSKDEFLTDAVLNKPLFSTS